MSSDNVVELPCYECPGCGEITLRPVAPPANGWQEFGCEHCQNTIIFSGDEEHGPEDQNNVHGD